MGSLKRRSIEAARPTRRLPLDALNQHQVDAAKPPAQSV